MTAPLSDPYAMLVAEVYHAAGEMRRAGEAIAREVGQTQARWQLMSVVSENLWTVPDAARELGITRQAVQRIADDLVADGLAAYAPNPRHQRSPFLELTPAGRDTLARITAASRSSNRRMARSLGAEQLLQTRDVLRKIIAALRAD